MGNSANKKRDRLSIDVLPKEHRIIKAYAAINDETIREYVLEAVRERLREDSEEKQLSDISAHISPALKELWANEKGASYDEM